MNVVKLCVLAAVAAFSALAMAKGDPYGTYNCGALKPPKGTPTVAGAETYKVIITSKGYYLQATSGRGAPAKGIVRRMTLKNQTPEAVVYSLDDIDATIKNKVAGLGARGGVDVSIARAGNKEWNSSCPFQTKAIH